MAFDTGHALIIGVGEYPSAPPLNVAQVTALDAQQVAKVVVDAKFCAYPEAQVRLLSKEQATRANILAELDRLAQTTKPGDTVFVFYSGHGMNDADGHYNLTTYDTRLDQNHKVVVGAGIAEQELLDKIRQIAATRALLVFNACHSGAIQPMTLGDDAAAAPSPSTGQNLPEQLTTALLGAGEGRVIITACRETQSSYFDRSDPATLFAKTLSDGLQGVGVANHKNTISLFDLYEYVFTTVSESAKQRWSVEQEPVLTISQGVGIMAVALYQGKNQPVVLGDDEEAAPDLSRLRGRVKRVDPQTSRAAFEQMMSVGTQNNAGRDIITITNAKGVAINPSGPIEMNFGDG
jgi:uncharacterized caspase-like protein